MNLLQFFDRWPAKEHRMFLFAGGKDHDRISVTQRVADHWRGKVYNLDFVSLHEPTFAELAESLRGQPLGKIRVVCAYELQWDDPENPNNDTAIRSLTKVLENFPRDVCLIASTPDPNPLTKNDLAQTIIRKGYWVVLKPVDNPSAVEFVQKLTSWDDEFSREVVQAVGTSPADILSLLKVLRIASAETPDEIRAYLNATATAGVFEVVDAVLSKDLKTALRTSNDDIPAGQLIGALDRKFTSLLLFIAELNKGLPPKEAAMALRLPGFIVHGLYEASKRWNGHEIVSLYQILAEHATTRARPGSSDILVTELVGV